MRKKILVGLIAWVVGGTLVGFVLAQYIHVMNYEFDPDYPEDDGDE